MHNATHTARPTKHGSHGMQGTARRAFAGPRLRLLVADEAEEVDVLVALFQGCRGRLRVLRAPPADAPLHDVALLQQVVVARPEPGG